MVLIVCSFNPFLLCIMQVSYGGENPFTPKASLLRYWNQKIQNNLPKPSFLLSKASPLTAIDSSSLLKLADTNSLSSHFNSFCSSANLFCFSDLSESLQKHDKDVNFISYNNENFTNYGASKPGGLDSFANYSEGQNIPVEDFRRYSRGAAGHSEKFTHYSPDGNVIDDKFNTYGATATGGKGEFTNYAKNVNVPNLKFTSYSSDANGRSQKFTSYSEDTNAGAQGFASYGKNGNGAPNDFTSYGKGSNVIGSTFSGYGEQGNGALDTFTGYAFDSNNPRNNFMNYNEGGNAGTDTFTSYRDQANVGDDSFQSYGKNSNSEKANFVNYGKSFNQGTDTFKGYGKGSDNHQVGFQTYGFNTTFKDYGRKGITFAKYTNSSSSSSSLSTSAMQENDKAVNRWVEPGKFFKESMLKPGTVMPMPDIQDKMPKRSFLPRSISSKLPFSTKGAAELKQIFHAGENSTMEGIIDDTLGDCERKPSPGESKQCVASVEDMIDFAVSVLGHNLVVRSTENVKGSKQDVMIGQVKGINGGKVTKSVSCHQSLFPYLVYYCHSVPKVRVYEAEILDAKSKTKINKAVAICHLDTSSWSPTHGAFVALGSSPGQTEVCHFIFENDMTWATSDESA
ncbi:Polygalacturonase 1 beta-like protein 3 [Ranunculus cassubicifolius]